MPKPKCQRRSCHHRHSDRDCEIRYWLMQRAVWRSRAQKANGLSQKYKPQWHLMPKSDQPLEIVVMEADTVSAACQQKMAPVTVLNFASAWNPGGGFIRGSMAQEESLCHSSDLYSNLRAMVYPIGNEELVWSPNVTIDTSQEFDPIGPTVVNVITAAARKREKFRHQRHKPWERIEMSNKMHMVLQCAKDHNVHCLILGAWGCGVFAHHPQDVAELWHEALTSYDWGLRRVVFAVPKDHNLPPFQRVFDK